MSVDRLHRIATALDVSPDELFATGSVTDIRVPVDEKSAEDGSRREFAELEMDIVLRAALVGIERIASLPLLPE